MVVEFAGGALEELTGDAPTLFVEASGSNADKVRFEIPTVHQLPDKRWRATFHILPQGDGVTLESIGPVELRACLKRGEDFLTETWAYRITP
jgi:glucans biosynthesis protein